ncbi:MAG: hypothetical protein K0R66_329 [Gammaproteobacteria bacterium]|jgi:hypothetical protein|nr:hypothetical protein [Gammaproteobacteria bacterium]
MGQPEYQDHVIAFIDLLGFSEALSNEAEHDFQKILELVTKLSHSKSDYQAITEHREDKGKLIRIFPAISSFSDNIVISYPIEAVKKDTNLDITLILMQIQSIVCDIAVSALKAGFLIRGGITIGKLYHKGGTILGKALIDAYNLERGANYPRIIIAKELLRHFERYSYTSVIKKDFDGISYLDYFNLAILNIHGTGIVDFEYLNNLIATTLETIRVNVERFEHEGKLKELAKWTWFSKYFDNTIQRLQPFLQRSKVQANPAN